jgi:glycosyltransferase involved in cell wall biosynthesis
MNIAVIFTEGAKDGGGFQYSLSVSTLLAKQKSQAYNFVFFTTKKQNVVILNKYGIKAFYLKWSNIDEFFSSVIRAQLISNIFRKLKIGINTKFDRILGKHNIDLIYFVSPTPLSLATEKFNYIFTVWDLCFRDFMEFPEVYVRREFERRGTLYSIALKKAIKVITDSQYTKEKIVRRYNVDEERIAYFPFLLPDSASISEEKYIKNYIDIKKKYNIIGDYIFYPAQFWPHKNHIYILEGLKIMKEKYNRRINAIFSGSDKGNLKFVLNRAKELGINDQIFYIGFADDTDLPYLYKQSLALVMPTYFGPTNLPPLEAFALGCPVLYSDLPGLRDQVREAALLLDLKNPESMCQGLLKIIENPTFAKELIKSGNKRVETLYEKDFWFNLKDVLDDYSYKLRCWK